MPKANTRALAEQLKAWRAHVEKAGDPVTYESAEAMTCEECGKDAKKHPMVLGPNCHPGAPVMAIYFQQIVLLYCAICGNTTCTIFVGRDDDATQTGKRQAPASARA